MLATEIRIVNSAYRLAEYIFTVTQNISKQAKVSIGRRLEDCVLDMIDCAAEANMHFENLEHRLLLIDRLRVCMVRMHMVVSLGVYKKFISIGQQANIERQLNDIGKQSTGWRKHTASAIGNKTGMGDFTE